jgi:hypothetical protein
MGEAAELARLRHEGNTFDLPSITFEDLGNDVGIIGIADIVSTAVVSGKNLQQYIDQGGDLRD